MPLICTSCFSNLTLFKRKSKCRICCRIFCISCLLKEKICQKCDMIFNHPLLKENLMQMKTKELMFYLDLLKISFTNCLEKEELVNLLIIHVSKIKPSISISSPSSGRSFDDMNANFEHIRNRCQNLFTSISDRLKSGDLSNRQTPSNSSSFYTLNDDNLEKKHDSRKQSIVVDNESKNSDYANTGSNFVDDQQSLFHHLASLDRPGTSKSFSTRRVSMDHSEEPSTLRMRNNESNYSTPTKASCLTSRNQMHLKQKCISDSNLIDKILNESSLFNDPKKKSCENCEKTRSKVKLKLCYAVQQLENVQPNLDSTVDDIKEILSETLESIDQLTDDTNQSSHPSSSLDSSLSIIPLPDTAILEESNHISLTPEVSQDCENSAGNRNVNIDIEFQGTIIEVGHSNSLSPIEPPFMTTSNLQSKRFFTLDDVKSKEELDDLSVKQLKEILLINRVNFKGCCEKSELKERVQRLWDDHASTMPIEKLPNEDLCKICFSSSVSCAFLECGHSCTCIDCGKVLNECPVCRQYIIRVLRIFKS